MVDNGCARPEPVPTTKALPTGRLTGKLTPAIPLHRSTTPCDDTPSRGILDFRLRILDLNRRFQAGLTSTRLSLPCAISGFSIQNPQSKIENRTPELSSW